MLTRKSQSHRFRLNWRGKVDDMHLVDLLSHAERISKIADSYGATNLAVFGSVARNQVGPNCDVD